MHDDRNQRSLKLEKLEDIRNIIGAKQVITSDFYEHLFKLTDLMYVLLTRRHGFNSRNLYFREKGGSDKILGGGFQCMLFCFPCMLFCFPCMIFCFPCMIFCIPSDRYFSTFFVQLPG